VFHPKVASKRLRCHQSTRSTCHCTVPYRPFEYRSRYLVQTTVENTTRQSLPLRLNQTTIKMTLMMLQTLTMVEESLVSRDLE